MKPQEPLPQDFDCESDFWAAHDAWERAREAHEEAKAERKKEPS